MPEIRDIVNFHTFDNEIFNFNFIFPILGGIWSCGLNDHGGRRKSHLLTVSVPLLLSFEMQGIK